MFKVAPRYLSGVSVFYGDDITRRETDGELVVFIGQSQKGPSVPITLRSVDNATPIFGIDSPLVKAIYEFWDGYADSGSAIPLKLVAMRIGGVASTLVTSLGVTLTTTDAYTGIEDDYYVYINAVDADSAKVKAWDKNKQLVLDTSSNINSGHITVTGTITVNGKEYGVNIDADPLETPVTLGAIKLLDIKESFAVDAASIPAVSDTTIVLDSAISDADFAKFPTSGTLFLTGTLGAITKTAYLTYTAVDTVTKTFTLSSAITAANDFDAAGMTAVSVGYVAASLVAGDSELDLSNREKYEKVRNALLDVETFTPDYIVPGGLTFDATDTFNKVFNETTSLKTATTGASTTVVVDAASTWPATGLINLYDGVKNDYVRYTVKEATLTDYTLTLSLPSFTLVSDLLAGATNALIAGTEADIAALPASGYIKLTDGAVNETVFYTRDAEVDNRINFAAIANPYEADTATVVKVVGVHATNATTVKISWVENVPFELGIGFVKETDMGDHYEFEWSDVKLPGYQIAHFGYLLANFCNEAAVGYNAPLCGMNVELPAAYDRASVVEWIGGLPTYKIMAGTTEAIEKVTISGTGLLGNPVLAGSVNYNRCYMSNPANSEFADPAYGLLMTDEGFIDGHEIKDSYYKVVDMGKFLCVGAGLLTFSNRAKGTPYTDSCGVYALGYLAGKPKNEGISFAQIGRNSNTTVGVIVSRKLYNDLAGLGYVVLSREKGLGWVINNDNSVARNESGYYLISTTRTIKYVVEKKRALLVGFIGKPINTYYYEAARTKLADSFKKDIQDGYLNGFDFNLQVADTARAIGKLYLKCILNPPLELVQVDIDTVIDRTVTTTA